MTMKLTDLGNGIKSIDFDAWGGIDNFLRETSTGAGGTAKPQLLRRVVPWLAKATDMTALAVSTLPFDILDSKGDVFDTSADWRNRLGGIDAPEKLLYNLAASLCLGKAYIIPTYTDRMIIDLHYCAPHTVMPLITVNGLQQFSRTSDFGQSGTYSPLNTDTEWNTNYTGEMMYFWLTDPDVEIGPAKTFPAGDALLASELINSMDATIKTISERGFVPPTILSVKGMLGQGERERAENWWNSFLRRWESTVAKIMNAEVMDVKQVGAGMADLKSVYGEMKKQAIEDIGTSFGIPAALFMSDMAFASEVNPLIKVWYSTSVFIKIYHTIEATFNEQLLSKFDLMLKFKPETLDAFQDNEGTRSASFSTYVNAGIKPSIAAQMVGMEMPEGLTYDDLDPEPQPAQLAQAAQPVTMTDDVQQLPPALDADMVKDLNLWRQMAVRMSRKGAGNMADFECKSLPETLAAPIRARLGMARNEAEIIHAFDMGKHETRTDERSIKYLADSINLAMASMDKQETDNMQIIIDSSGNAVKMANRDNSEILQAIKALAGKSAETVVIPAPIVNITNEVNPTPVTVTNDVTMATMPAPAVNVTVQPADVIIPTGPREATITTDPATGKRTLKVTK